MEPLSWTVRVSGAFVFGLNRKVMPRILGTVVRPRPTRKQIEIPLYALWRTGLYLTISISHRHCWRMDSENTLNVFFFFKKKAEHSKSDSRLNPESVTIETFAQISVKVRVNFITGINLAWPWWAPRSFLIRLMDDELPSRLFSRLNAGY